QRVLRRGHQAGGRSAKPGPAGPRLPGGRRRPQRLPDDPGAGPRPEPGPPRRRRGRRAHRRGHLRRLRPTDRQGDLRAPGRRGLTRPARSGPVPAMSAAPRLAFLASDRPEAIEARARLAARYGDTPQGEAEVLVALGGDGFMLETLHRTIDSRRPIYGMNRGSVGFLMNDYAEDDLPERIAAAEQATIHPLSMQALDHEGRHYAALAINEVSLLRQTRQ